MMRCLWIPLPRTRWRPPRFIAGGMRKSPGLIHPWGTRTLHVTTFQWVMNHLNNCFHRWHCASGSRNDYLLPCGNDIPLQDPNRLYFRISNKVAYRDPDDGSLATSAKCISVTRSLWECLRVVGLESQGGQIPGLTGPDAVAIRLTWQHLGAPATELGAPTTSLGAPASVDYKPGIAGDKHGSTSNHCTAVWEKQHLDWQCCWCPWKS